MIYEIIDALTSYYNKLGDEETLGRCFAYMKKYFPLDDVYILDRELDRRYCCRKCGKKWIRITTKRDMATLYQIALAMLAMIVILILETTQENDYGQYQILQ